MWRSNLDREPKGKMEIVLHDSEDREWKGIVIVVCLAHKESRCAVRATAKARRVLGHRIDLHLDTAYRARQQETHGVRPLRLVANARR